MADQLNKVVKKIVQRTSTNTGKLRTEDERAAFSNNVRADLASIFDQLNTVYYPLVSALMSEQTLNALDYGLSGNVLKTHITSDEASATAYWDKGLARARTVKETIDVLLAEIARLESLITELGDAEAFDDSELWAELTEQDLDLTQLAKDTMGPSYTLDGDGNANLSYSLSQALDAIGAFFTGWPGTGNTYTSTYPSLTLQILLSSVTLDVTIPQSTITGLVGNLAAIRNFVGMDSALDGTPDYSAYGSISYVIDGDSLEEAIAKLDQAISGLLPAFSAGAVLFGDGTDVPAYDATNFFWDNTNNRLGIGTNTPEQPLDVRGIVQHDSGIISRGGLARGTGANDFQVSRSNVAQVASGARSTILGGQNNTASGADSIAGGAGSAATNTNAIAIGNGCFATGPNAIATGLNTTASGQSSSAMGDGSSAEGSFSQAAGRGSRAWLTGQRSWASTIWADDGDAQFSDVVVRRETVGAGNFELFIDGAAERVVLLDNHSYSVIATVIARDSAGLTNHYVLEGTLKRNAGAATTVLVGAVTKRIVAEEQVAGDANLIADNVNGAAVIEVVGIPNTTVRWVARLEITQVYLNI